MIILDGRQVRNNILDDIKTNLKNTRFFERLFGTTPAFIENHVDKNEKYKAELGAEETTNTVININKIAGSSDSDDDEVIENIIAPSTNIEEDSVWSNASGFSNEELDKELTDDLKNLIDNNGNNESNVTNIFSDSEMQSIATSSNEQKNEDGTHRILQQRQRNR